MAKIIFKVVKVIVKVFAAFAAICALYAAGAITWSGIKEAWISYFREMSPVMDKYI